MTLSPLAEDPFTKVLSGSFRTPVDRTEKLRSLSTLASQTIEYGAPLTSDLADVFTYPVGWAAATCIAHTVCNGSRHLAGLELLAEDTDASLTFFDAGNGDYNRLLIVRDGDNRRELSLDGPYLQLASAQVVRAAVDFFDQLQP